MAIDQTCCKLCKDHAIARTIKVTNETEGHHYLVETVDTSYHGEGASSEAVPIAPDFSWRHFTTLAEAGADAEAQYEASLKEGFTPLP